MTSELPDLDEPISFAVDHGAQAGPFTMRVIIDSIRTGQRAPNTLVWWAGEADWVSFDSVPGLLALVDDSSVDEPASDETGVDAEQPADADTSSPFGGSRVGVFEEAGSTGFDSPTADEVSDFASPAADEATAVFESTSELTDFELSEGTEFSVGSGVFDTAEDDQDDWSTLPGDPEAVAAATEEAHDAFGAGDAVAEGVEPDLAASEVEYEASTEIVDADEGWEPQPEMVTEAPEDSFTPGSVLADLDRLGSTQADEPSALSPLQSVSERIDALGAEAPRASAGLLDSGRRSIQDAARIGFGESDASSDDADDAGGEDSGGDDAEGGENVDGDAAFDELDEIAETSSDVDEATPGDDVAGEDGVEVAGDHFEEAGEQAASHFDEEPSEPSPEDETVDEWSPEDAGHRSSRFADMVARSRELDHTLEWATKLDDAMLGEVIRSTRDRGYRLIDLTSAGSDRLVRFEHPNDGNRFSVGIAHLPAATSGGQLLAQSARVTIRWGRQTADSEELLVDEGAASAGTITVEADPEVGYAYSSVDLLWPVEDYIEATTHGIDAERVSDSIAAALDALREELDARLTD